MLQLRQARIRAGYTIEQLARRADLSTHHVNDLEHGKHVPLWSTLQKLAKALGVPVEVLTSEQEQTGQEGEDGRSPAGGHQALTAGVDQHQAVPPGEDQHQEGDSNAPGHW